MIYVGTSGYNYPEWKGSFYPSDLSAAKMLPYYAARFPTVEINYTFYRMPTEKLLAGWTKQVPSTFKFTLKAPRRITHDAKLVNCEVLTAQFCLVAGTLGAQLGRCCSDANMKKMSADRCVLDTCHQGPGGFEFRHPSWFDATFRGLMRGTRALRGRRERLETPLE